MFAKDVTVCFSYCFVEGGDHCIYVCIFTVLDGERCKRPAYHSLEGIQRIESCVIWLVDFFPTKVEDHHHQVVVTSNISSWKTSCSGTVHSCLEALPH